MSLSTTSLHITLEQNKPITPFRTPIVFGTQNEKKRENFHFLGRKTEILS